MLRHDFAAIMLDIRMPGMSGIELAQLIKQRKRTQHVPILFLTAHLVDDDDVLRGYGVGAVDYLSKPVNADILRSKIGVFIELYQKTRALATLNEALQKQVAAAAEGTRSAPAGEPGARAPGRRTDGGADLGAPRRERERRTPADGDGSRAKSPPGSGTSQSGQMTWSTDPEALFGFPAGSFGEDRRVFRALHPDDRARVEAADRGGAAHRLPVRVRVSRRASRRHRRVDHRARTGAAQRRGASRELVGLSRDVSAQRRAEAAREQALLRERRARDEAERQSRLKDEFLATLSHELRTPMNAILGWLALLARGDGVKDPKHAITVIQRNAQLQAKLIEDLLEMNRLASGTVRLEVAPLDIHGALSSAVDALRPTAEAKNVHLSLSADPGLPQIHADGRRIQQILWNVLQNAVKFTGRGGTVDTVLQQVDGRVCIVVKDTGRGIAPDFLPHIFERFRQEDQSTTREASGLGIGLSIAKYLVELHGGSIHAASPGVNQGATFVVELPILASSGISGGEDRDGLSAATIG